MKINLEEKLIKENKKLLTPEELLIIKEFNSHENLVNNDALSRIGLNKNIQEGKKIQYKLKNEDDVISKYNPERVFHISQIESICNKYYLRFLEAKCFNGVIDNSLPEKITNFEVAYNEKMNSYNSYIMAPAKSFKLEEKSKDPLLFCKISDEHYYLVHKWGNDFSILRRFTSLLSSALFTFIVLAFIAPLPFLFIDPVIHGVVSLITIFGVGLWNLLEASDLGSEGYVTFIPQNKWNSKYKI